MENNCTLLVALPDKQALPTVADITAELESPEPWKKIAALKNTIMLVLAGEEMPRVLMTVIRYCITVEDHTLQKLLMLYWECVRKYDSAGKLLPEMILVCNALRNNLLHPNEYIRGCTLRFLCKLREPELLEPVIPAVKQCLTHRHPYVRRNAVLTVYSVVRQFPELYPDAVDEIVKLLEDESDASTRRNAFVMLFSCAGDRAVQYLLTNLDKLLNFGDGFALILLELIRKISKTEASNKAKFIRIVFSLLDAPSPAVSYEAAGTLLSLTAAPSAVRAAAGAYIKILNKEADNNVKLIILERLAAMRKRHAKPLRECVMDILRCLATPNVDIRRRTLDVAMDLISPRNVEEVMALLKKEIIAAGGKDGVADPEAVAYRKLLIAAIHGCAVRFPEVASNVVHLLMDFLNGPGALHVIEFVREIVETYPEMRAGVLSKLRMVADDISSSDVYRVALWILGQYSQSDEEVAAAFHSIRECMGPLPLTMPYGEYVAHVAAVEAREAGAGGGAGAAEKEGAAASGGSRKPLVLADGTYASQSGLTVDASSKGDRDPDDTPVPSLRKLLLAGDFFLASVVAATLTKLALRATEHHGREHRQSKAVIVDSMLVMCALLELGASGVAGTSTLLPAHRMPAVNNRTYGTSASTTRAPAAPAPGTPMAGAPLPAPTAAPTAVSSSGVRIDQDSFERIVLCMRVLGDPAAAAATLPVLLRTCRDTFRGLLAERRARAVQAAKDGVVTGGGMGLLSLTPPPTDDSADATAVKAHVEDMLSIRQLRGTKASGVEELALDDEADLSRAAGQGTEDFQQRLKRVHQLTGFADPVYCEAYVRVAEFDIILELTVINRSDVTLTNVQIEMSVMGDLKLVERPGTFTLGPRDSKLLKASIKVASTETGHIFGTLVYTPAGSVDVKVINLAEIHVDIMDYIVPATCTDAAFRSMWADFEWENKVSVNTNINNLHDFVRHIAKMTNMRILTPIDALPATVPFLAANLYAKSVFGEDALVNVSVELKADGGIRGHIRIRAKTQGVALSLGDRITSKQKA